jgi:hypothetical protein
MAAKRLAGNRRVAAPARRRAYLRRLLFDNDGDAV